MNTNKFDIIVVGGGHAGIEAAFVSANMGCRVALLTMDLQAIGRPSCNPSIGGTAKGHLVKEIDALGGAMGMLADKAGLLFKMLNVSKGPAVWSPRTQIDKDLYPIYALDLLLKTKGLTLVKGTASEILLDKGRVSGLVTSSNETLFAEAVVLCAGTFLNGVMFTGTNTYRGGRWGEPPADKISDLLAASGMEKGRLKTGTPPRVFAESIDYSKTSLSGGDDSPIPFSFRTKKVKNVMMCWATETSELTHDILRTGFDRSPMFAGRIQGVGPRYCPSIEDKINRFADKNSHKILLEPEGLNTSSVYVNGYSTSLPEDIQEAGLRTIPGLENMKIKRYGYAIEYDIFFPYQLNFTLETKQIEGLFFAGQINGTSGYEEAAAQGLVAGINASLKVKGEGDFSLKRSEAYIGVLIDDLINKHSEEPYRMFTSLAEYRLLLRQDNALERLMKYGYQFGLISEKDYHVQLEQEKLLEKTLERVRAAKLKPADANDYLKSVDEMPLNESASLFLLGKRKNTKLSDMASLLPEQDEDLNAAIMNMEIYSKVNIEIKYEGYIERQRKEVEYFMENEKKRIPNDFDYDVLNSISTEAREKLKRIRPASLGQASRIAGVSATDVSILSLYLR